MHRISLFIFLAIFATALFAHAQPNTIWLEAEDAQETNFDPGPMVNVALDGPSGFASLRLHVKDDPSIKPELPFVAELKFDVKEEGKYHLWIAGSPQNVNWASTCKLQLDTAPPLDLRGKAWSSAPYDLKEHLLGWYEATQLSLKPGPHTITFTVSSPRKIDNLYAFFLDAIVLTTDDTFKPSGNHPKYSPHPLRTDFKPGEKEMIRDQLELQMYRNALAKSNEQVSPETEAEVLKKLRARPLPTTRRSLGPEFGLHGMERPFVQVHVNAEKAREIYDLLARAGVDGFRSAEGCWSRLGTNFDHFDELDFQLEQAHKYGMTHLLTIGYPPSQFTVADHYLSAVQPKYEPLFREYLRALFSHCKDKGVEYFEFGNEVDATETWWRQSTADMYVHDLQIVKEELAKFNPHGTIKLVAIAATRSRSEKGLTDSDGRAFVRRCFDLGMDHFADAYSLHYADQIRSRDFVDFMRGEIKRAGSNKPLLDSEQDGGANPCDAVRTFARCFFLYNMPRVDYYMARDLIEASGSILDTSLFDCEWNPKLRLLAYAASVDAMKYRELEGIAEPADGIEAYVLRAAASDITPAYSIVMWNNTRELKNLPTTTPIAPRLVDGLVDPVRAMTWRLDPIPVSGSLPVGEQPVIVFTNQKPNWQLFTPTQYLQKLNVKGIKE